MELLEIVDMINTKEHEQVWSISFLTRKQDQEWVYMKKLAQKLHKPVIKKYKKRKVNWRFKDNIWAADLAEKGSLSSKNKSFNYLLSAIDIFTKYTWVKTLKDKTGKTVLNAFIEIVNDSNHKPSKLWVDQGRELYNQLMQEWLDNNILMHSAYNEGKSVIAERFIKTLKAKIYKKMTVDVIILPWLKKLRQIFKLLSLKLMIESELLSIRIFLVNITFKIGHEKYLLLILFWKLILELIKLKM